MNKKFIWGLGIFIIIYFFIQLISHFYMDYQWFKINKHINIFWTLFLSKFYVNIIFSLLFISLFSLNFLLIRILAGKGRIFTKNIFDRLQLPVIGSTKKALFLFLFLGVVAIGLMMGITASTYWKECLIYLNSVPFSSFPKDPIFKKDIGFYIFSIPFYKFFFRWGMFSLVIITIFSTLFHILNGGIFIENKRVDFSLFSRAHLSTLLSIIVFLMGIGYRISAYEILLSQRGSFYGAGYTAVNAELLAYNVCMIISFIASALLIFNIFKRSFLLPIVILITIIPTYFILGTVYPSLQQRFVVEPNELDREKPYIKNNISLTRIAYGIDRVKEMNFSNNSNLTSKDMIKNRNTLNNIRLWDWRPLKQTYKQLQELKPYYHFYDVDVDRYIIKGSKIAVNLSARELSIDKLSKNSQTWINRHLVYTHGYGLVCSRVDKITPEGLPEMLIYDIPPKSKINIEPKLPQIYYGEHNNPYCITNTSIEPGEFDYPYGDMNRYTKYQGTGGDRLNSFFKRLLYAIALGDMNIFISKNIESKSKILFRRNISTMVRSLTPFLEFDNDPYLILANDKLYWIIDAYTTTDRFPYSTPTDLAFGKINYIRNSVKVVIDAYNGEMNYYIADDNDPILKTYANIFKGLFKNISQMPEEIKNHIRYPEMIFNIQSKILLRYHMTNINVFYNNEDAWDIPRQIYENSEELIHSYYLVTTLPDESRSEFILIMPFTPINKDNMISFLIAKCDPPYYGQLILYILPKEKLSYGPMQIEARINQDAEISKQLTLWSQKGSRVIRGNMLVIPIEESLLFIEPLYLKAETSEMPELKRVIVSFSDKIVMEENLNAALDKLFLKDQYTKSMISTGSMSNKLREYASRAFQHFLLAEKHLQKGNWAKYGEELRHLKEILRVMKNIKD
ncbi:MAG: UPF0182 family protein [Spirochaetota bacterium]|nr:UPF0182 family protein [Spirochaetota bacterium]